MLKTFNPNVASEANSGIFGLPFTPEEAKLMLLPVPWEATTSYGGGTAKGPQAIFAASKQIDLFDMDFGQFYEKGIAMLDESKDVIDWNQLACQATTFEVNQYSKQLNDYVYEQTKKFLDAGKYIGVVGGDHSTPFGAISAFLEKYPNMGMLHIDAHADLRDAFEGFEYSHASIMHNVITKTKLTQLVQVGIRDFCEEEYTFIQQHRDRITTFFDSNLFEAKIHGKSWVTICDDIIQTLPHEVYISFDIDGLNPQFCPNTGTPVPGGLDFHEAIYLLKKVHQSGRKIIGFDLNEVSPGTSTSEWDANVGARILYKLCALVLTSN